VFLVEGWKEIGGKKKQRIRLLSRRRKRCGCFAHDVHSMMMMSWDGSESEHGHGQECI